MSTVSIRPETVKERRVIRGFMASARTTAKDPAVVMRLIKALDDQMMLADYWRQRCVQAEQRRGI